MSTADPRHGADIGSGQHRDEFEHIDVTDGGTASETSLSDLISRLGDDVTTLFRQEVELAKVELKREASAAGKAAGMLGAGAFLGLIALLLLAWAAAWGLAAVLPIGVAFLVVGLVFGLVAAAVAMTGRKQMQQLDPTPHATIETMQRNKQVLTDRSNR